MNYLKILSAFVLICLYLQGFGAVTFSSYSPIVEEAQIKLQNLGYDPGEPDGILGKRTREALRKYQEDCGLPVSGNLDQATIKKLDLKKTHLPECKFSAGLHRGHEIKIADAGSGYSLDRYGNTTPVGKNWKLAPKSSTKDVDALIKAGIIKSSAKNDYLPTENPIIESHAGNYYGRLILSEEVTLDNGVFILMAVGGECFWPNSKAPCYNKPPDGLVLPKKGNRIIGEKKGTYYMKYVASPENPIYFAQYEVRHNDKVSFVRLSILNPTCP